MAEATVQAPSAKTNLSRRNLIALALPIPLAAIASTAIGFTTADLAAQRLADALPATDRAAWERAVAAYELALVELDRVSGTAADWDRLIDTHGDAYRALLATPSPDVDALAYKLRAAWGADGEGEPSQRVKAMILGDAQRLAGKMGS